MFSSMKERWSRSAQSKQKRSFSPRLERPGPQSSQGGVHSRNTSANTELSLKSAALSSITTLRPSPPISPSIESSPLNSQHFAAVPTSVVRRKSMIFPSKSFNEEKIFVTPRRLKSALDLKAPSPFSYSATPSPHYVPPSHTQPLPEALPFPRNAAPRPNRLVTPQERELARHALQEKPDPIDLCIADNIEYDLNHGLLIAPKLPPSPLQLVYNVKTNTFRRERRNQLLKNGEEGEVLVLEESNPPLMVDGRKIILEVPRWSRAMEIWWRVIDVNGVIRKKNARIVFPLGVWLERNFGAAREKGMELFIEK